MARGFRRTRHGYRCRLEPAEALVVRQLAREVDALIAAEAGTGRPAGDDLEALLALPAEAPERPADPVLSRLFPDAYADAEDAADFRRYTMPELSAGKRAALAVVRDTVDDRGGEVTLDEEAAQVWLTALNDLRLALGTRIGVTDDEQAGRPPSGDDLALLYDVYDLLTFLQGTLVEAVAGW